MAAIVSEALKIESSCLVKSRKTITPTAGIPVFAQVEIEGERRRDNLSDDDRHRRARDPHARETAQAENHDWVEDDIDDHADALGDHRVEGAAGRLEQLFKDDLSEEAKGAEAADRQVGHTVLDNLGDVRLEA